MIEGNKLLKAVLKRSVSQVEEAILDDEDPFQTDEEGRTYLHLSVFLRCNDLVVLFLNEGLLPDVCDSDKITPLHRACRSGCDKIVETLISHGANVNARASGNKTPLHIAAAFGHNRCVQVLISQARKTLIIDCEDDQRHTPLHYAVAEGHVAVVKTLIKNGCDVNAENTSKNTPLHFAATSELQELCQVLIQFNAKIDAQNNKLQTPLFLATLSGCKENVFYMLGLSADPNIVDIDGNTCSHLAIRNGHTDLIEILMIDKRTDSTISDEKRDTVLHLALKLGHFNLIPLMLPRAKDLTKQDANGCSVIIEAIKNQLEELALQMLQICPSLAFTTTHDLVTPLHLAAERGMTNLTRQLLIEGAQVDAADSSGLTPSLYCAKNDHVLECLAMIENIMMDSDNSMDERQQQQQQQQHVKGDSSRLSSRISS